MATVTETIAITAITLRAVVISKFAELQFIRKANSYNHQAIGERDSSKILPVKCNGAQHPVFGFLASAYMCALQTSIIVAVSHERLQIMYNTIDLPAPTEDVTTSDDFLYCSLT
jgi:hypothetical protein